jgi:hypothetical protein
VATNQQHGSSIQYDSRAVFAKLIALNVFFESALAGAAAQDFSNNAQSCHTLLTIFLDEIKARAV